MNYFKPYHQWEALAAGESIVVNLPLIDLVAAQERLAAKGMIFKLESIAVDAGPFKTRVERVS